MSTESVELQRVRGRQLLLAFALGLVFFILRRQLYESTWVPMGADWDSWLQGAVSLRFGGSYPMVRWPLYGFCVAVVDFFYPRPFTFLRSCCQWRLLLVQQLSLLDFGAVVLGSALGMAWVVLLSDLSFKHELCRMVLFFYALWGCACVWTVISMFEYHQSKQLKWAFGMGVGAAFSLAIMAKGLALRIFLCAFRWSSHIKWPSIWSWI